MAQTYFADAWYFIALLEPRDTHHRNAVRLERFVAGSQLVTHDGVLTEVLTYFADEGAHARTLAAQTVRHVLAHLEVVPIDRTLFSRTVDFYERRHDKEYSFADCVSMLVMRSRGITRILTNDRHFRQEGFTVVSDAS